MLEKYKMSLETNILWIIFWAIFWFPIAVMLIFLGGTFSSPTHKHYIEYNGSIFWLGFWLILFFPIALLLLMVNGLTLCKQELIAA